MPQMRVIFIKSDFFCVNRRYFLQIRLHFIHRMHILSLRDTNQLISAALPQ